MTAELRPVSIIRSTKLTALSGEQAIANWSTISGMLEPALKYSEGRVDIDDVRQHVEDEMTMIIIAWNPQTGDVYLAFAAESNHYATGLKTMNLSLAGGNSSGEWRHLWPELKGIAKRLGFDQIELTGRPGWGRVFGLKEKCRTFIEDL
jgi:hypothetical protein